MHLIWTRTTAILGENGTLLIKHFDVTNNAFDADKNVVWDLVGIEIVKINEAIITVVGVGDVDTVSNEAVGLWEKSHLLRWERLESYSTFEKVKDCSALAFKNKIERQYKK